MTYDRCELKGGIHNAKLHPTDLCFCCTDALRICVAAVGVDRADAAIDCHHLRANRPELSSCSSCRHTRTGSQSDKRSVTGMGAQDWRQRNLHQTHSQPMQDYLWICLPFKSPPRCRSFCCLYDYLELAWESLDLEGA